MGHDAFGGTYTLAVSSVVKQCTYIPLDTLVAAGVHGANGHSIVRFSYLLVNECIET